jgi:hypothetical protein
MKLGLRCLDGMFKLVVEDAGGKGEMVLTVGV